MGVTWDRRAHTELNTIGVPAADAFSYWCELICAAFVGLAADPVGEGRFRGQIEYVPCGDIELSTVVADSHRVRRTRALINRDDQEYLLASIQLAGCGRIEQDGRTAALTAGALAFYDSTRPYSLCFDAPFHQLVIQLPKRELNIPDTRGLTARALGSGTPAVVVSSFFTSLHEAARDDAAQTAALVPHAVGLLAATASYAAGAGSAADAADALMRQQISNFLHRNFTNPGLDASTVAHACKVSRRTLYRAVGDEGIAAQLRRIRIAHAKQILARDPRKPIASVGAACGFDSESGFYRAFREITGQTPGDYRQAVQHIGGEIGTQRK